jgi:hypothetical protein
VKTLQLNMLLPMTGLNYSLASDLAQMKTSQWETALLPAGEYAVEVQIVHADSKGKGGSNLHAGDWQKMVRSSRQRTKAYPSSMPQPFSPGGSCSFSDEEFMEQSISDEPDDSLSPHAHSDSQRSRSPVVSSSRSSDESASSASSSFESFDSLPTDA